jgi:hypothetical protein
VKALPGPSFEVIEAEFLFARAVTIVAPFASMRALSICHGERPGVRARSTSAKEWPRLRVEHLFGYVLDGSFDNGPHLAMLGFLPTMANHRWRGLLLTSSLTLT